MSNVLTLNTLILQKIRKKEERFVTLDFDNVLSIT